MALATTAGLLFVTFVYAFPYVFSSIEAGGLQRFEQNSAQALMQGEVERALRIARRARGDRPYDPLAPTVHAEVLLTLGRTEEAVEALAAAVSIQKEQRPPYRDTIAPYYFARARLVWGQIFVNRNDWVNAAAQFELARGDADLTEPQYARFHSALYRTYSELGLWQRALAFGTPSSSELEALDHAALLSLARVSEGNRQWALLRRCADRLLAREVSVADGEYFLGRAALSAAEMEDAEVHLQRALDLGHPDAGFFLGEALEDLGAADAAQDAYRQTSRDSLYRAFALARILALPGQPAAQTKTREELNRLLAGGGIAASAAALPLYLFDSHHRWRPVTILHDKAYAAAGGRFPLLVLWEDLHGVASSDYSAPLATEGVGTMAVSVKNFVAQLQWVENLIHWAAVEALPTGATVFAGWIDSAKDWHGVRFERIATRGEEDGNAYLRITNPDIHHLAWYYSVPVATRASGGYVLAGRLRGPQSRRSLGWEGLSPDGGIIEGDDVFIDQRSEDWIPQAGYVRSRRHWDAIRVRLDVMRHAETVDFDEVMLVEVAEPGSHPAMAD